MPLASLVTPRRLIAVLTAFALLFGVMVTSSVSTAAPAAAAASPRAEAVFVAKINKERAHRKVRRLVVRADLVRVARAQAARMASQHRMYHNPRLGSQVRNYRWVGENVGYSSSATKLHVALMRSPSHKANIVDRGYTEVGVGVVVRGGRIWMVQVFRQPRR